MGLSYRSPVDWSRPHEDAEDKDSLKEGDALTLRWLCRRGLHVDVRKHAVDGAGYYAKCRRCGREQDIAPEFGG